VRWSREIILNLEDKKLWDTKAHEGKGKRSTIGRRKEQREKYSIDFNQPVLRGRPKWGSSEGLG